MAETRPPTDIDRFLPLTPVAFEILLAVAQGERHGYGIMQDIEASTGGKMRLNPGTLYRALGRLEDSALIKELAARPAPDLDDERRRYYQITAKGRQALSDRIREWQRFSRAMNSVMSPEA